MSDKPPTSRSPESFVSRLVQSEVEEAWREVWRDLDVSAFTGLSSTTIFLDPDPSAYRIELLAKEVGINKAAIASLHQKLDLYSKQLFFFVEEAALVRPHGEGKPTPPPEESLYSAERSFARLVEALLDEDEVAVDGAVCSLRSWLAERVRQCDERKETDRSFLYSTLHDALWFSRIPHIPAASFEVVRAWALRDPGAPLDRKMLRDLRKALERAGFDLIPRVDEESPSA